MVAAVERRKALSLVLAATGGLLLTEGHEREALHITDPYASRDDGKELILRQIEETVDFAMRRQQRQLTEEEKQKLVDKIYQEFEAIINNGR